MAVIATAMITDADTCRGIVYVVRFLLPMMSFDKIVGKFAKSSGNAAMIGELLSELVLIYGRSTAVVNSKPSWDFGARQYLDKY